MFWLLFLGQTITSATYLMENNGCSKMSAIWFPPHERTIATTLYSVIASQVRGRKRGREREGERKSEGKREGSIAKAEIKED